MTCANRAVLLVIRKNSSVNTPVRVGMMGPKHQSRSRHVFYPTKQWSCFHNSGLQSLSFVSRKNGRISFYGPTSFGCAIGGTALEAHFLPTWSQIKNIRKEWKAEHQYSTQTNVNFLSSSPSLITGGSVLEALCAYLPDVALIEKLSEDFFDGSFY